MFEGDNLKKILSLVIIVVLALASFNILSLPHVSAQTTAAQILSYSSYIAPSTTTSAEYANDLIAVGEVQNTGSNVVGAVLVIGQAYDSNGTLLASTEARVMETNMAPNQKAPFYLDFIPEGSVTQDQSWVSNETSLTVLVGSVTNATGTSSQYTGLTTSDLNGVNNGGTYTVSGKIQDAGDQSVGDTAVIATFYSSNGTVVALSFTDLGAGLAPGESTTFAVTPWDNTGTLSSEIASYAIMVQSTPVTLIGTTEPTAPPTTQPTYSPGGSTNPTQNTGVSESTAQYALIIVVVAAVIAVLAVFMFLRRQGKSQQVEASTTPSESSGQL
jgi:hypothetical protein